MPRITIRDVCLYYEMTGQGEPLLFIHGLGSSTRDWEQQVAFFAPHYQVLTVDLRGHGRSDKPRGRYSIALFADDIAALVQELGAVPVHIVGLSLGGAVAFQLAVDAPQLLKSLVIVNSAPEARAYTLKQRFLLLINSLQRQIIVRLFGMRKMGETLSKHLFPKPEQSELQRIFIERWAENDPRAYLASFKALMGTGWSVTDRIGNIQCPTLVITADQDYSPVAFKEAYVAKIPGAELVVIPDARHFTPAERPEAFNAALMSFLSRQR